jgi:hypothetical protein
MSTTVIHHRERERNLVGTLSAIEQELVLLGILIKGIVKIFRGILQSGSFPRLADLYRRPRGDKTGDEIYHEGVNIVGIARKEFSCKGSHVDWEEVVGSRIKGGMGVYIFSVYVCRKGAESRRSPYSRSPFRRIVGAAATLNNRIKGTGRLHTDGTFTRRRLVLNATCQFFLFPKPDL